MRTHRVFRTFSVTLMIAGSAIVSGCGSNDEPEPVVQSAPRETFTVHIDQGNNGAVGAKSRRSASAERSGPRSLMFETSGVADVPRKSATQEQWAAAREAAVLDALAKAVIESRRSAGLPDEEFLETFNSRMSMAHRVSDDGVEFEVRLVVRGMERIFLIRDGELQHPPHDFELVRRVFAETNGRYTLLPVDESPTDRYIARVGCYELADEMGTFAGGDVQNEPAGDMLDGDLPDAATP